MTASDPTPFIEKIDLERWNELRRHKPTEEESKSEITYVEPAGEQGEAEEAHGPSEAEVETPSNPDEAKSSTNAKIVGKVQRLGDMVDTDAV